MLFAQSAKSKEGFQLTSDVDVESVPGFFNCTYFFLFIVNSWKIPKVYYIEFGQSGSDLI